MIWQLHATSGHGESEGYSYYGSKKDLDAAVRELRQHAQPASARAWEKR